MKTHSTPGWVRCAPATGPRNSIASEISARKKSEGHPVVSRSRSSIPGPYHPIECSASKTRWPGDPPKLVKHGPSHNQATATIVEVQDMSVRVSGVRECPSIDPRVVVYDRPA